VTIGIYRRWGKELVQHARTVDLVGPGGLLTGLTKTVLETTLDVELTEHLGYDNHDPASRGSGNSRNGSRDPPTRSSLHLIRRPVIRIGPGLLSTLQ
jgi:hypothetical protein